MNVSVYGVACAVSPTVTWAPVGELAKVTATVFGCSTTVRCR